MKNIVLTLSSFCIVFSACFGQIKNAKVETAHVVGVCNMCQKTIETAGSKKHVSRTEWDSETQLASITYNPDKTSKDEVLKQIALAGYDNEAYLAPDLAYSQLSGCCQYDRDLKSTASNSDDMMEVTSENQTDHHATQDAPISTAMMAIHLQPVYEAYFLLKDALVKSGDPESSVESITTGNILLAALKAVEMNKLTTEEHMQWMKLQSPLISDTEKITKVKDVDSQRQAFATLSSNMYQLMKTSKLDIPVYLQHCPMYGDGADWLSKDINIKNPYFGSMMLTCGKTVETLKQ